MVNGIFSLMLSRIIFEDSFSMRFLVNDVVWWDEGLKLGKWLLVWQCTRESGQHFGKVRSYP